MGRYTKFKNTIIVLGIILVAFMGSVFEEMGTAMTGIMVGSGLCKVGDNCCIFRNYLIVAFVVIAIALLFDSRKIKNHAVQINNTKELDQKDKKELIKPLNKYQKISKSKTNEIDISIKSKPRHSGQTVGLVIINNDKNKPVFCKAIIKKMDWYKEDPRKENVWIPIDTEEFNALSWHYRGTDNDGFKKVHIKPEFLNIVNFPTNMSQQIITGGILWRFTFSFIHEEKEFFAGKYRMQIDIICKMNDEYNIESWFGCIDTPKARESSIDWSELEIWECEDVKNWK